MHACDGCKRNVHALRGVALHSERTCAAQAASMHARATACTPLSPSTKRTAGTIQKLTRKGCDAPNHACLRAPQQGRVSKTPPQAMRHRHAARPAHTCSLRRPARPPVRRSPKKQKKKRKDDKKDQNKNAREETAKPQASAGSQRAAAALQEAQRCG